MCAGQVSAARPTRPTGGASQVQHHDVAGEGPRKQQRARRPEEEIWIRGSAGQKWCSIGQPRTTTQSATPKNGLPARIAKSKYERKIQSVPFAGFSLRFVATYQAVHIAINTSRSFIVIILMEHSTQQQQEEEQQQATAMHAVQVLPNVLKCL
jgi:hypothetical protein